MKMAGNALAIRFTTWQFPIFSQKILLKFVKKINNHISNNMNYHAHTMTIINTITIVSIAILLTHDTSSKKINAKLALQFSLFFPRITFGQYICLNIDALGFFYIRTPQLAHIQDPLWAVGMSKLSYILVGQMPTRRYLAQVETSDYLNKPARYDRGLRSHPS